MYYNPRYSNRNDVRRKTLVKTIRAQQGREDKMGWAVSSQNGGFRRRRFFFFGGRDQSAAMTKLFSYSIGQLTVLL